MEAFDIPALHALCIELSIPGPAAEACLAQAASAQAAPLLRHIPALLDASRAEALTGCQSNVFRGDELLYPPTGRLSEFLR